MMKRDRGTDEDTPSTWKKSRIDEDVAVLVATSYKEDDGVIEEGALYVAGEESKEAPDSDSDAETQEDGRTFIDDDQRFDYDDAMEILDHLHHARRLFLDLPVGKFDKFNFSTLISKASCEIYRLVND